MRNTTVILGFVLVGVVAIGCQATPAQHSYITDYQVMGDKTVKYIYLPGEESRAGGAYLDQGLAVEICSLESQEIGEDDGDAEPEPEEQDGIEAVDEADVEGGQEGVEISEEDRVQYLTVETDCEQTRLLKTEEFR